MSVTDTSPGPSYEEFDDSGPDRVAQVLKWAIVFVVLCIVAVALYAVTAGVLSPPAPRTQAESLLIRSEAAVKKNPGDGAAWAQYARVLYLTGDEEAATEAIKKGRKSVKDDSIRWINVQEVDMTLGEGQNEKALKLTTKYIQDDLNIRAKQMAKDAAGGIQAPLETQENNATIRMFVLRATAEMNLKKYKDAAVSCDNALKMEPTAADIITLRGWANLKAGNKKAAKQDFEKALAFMPDDPSATEGLQQVKSAK